MEKMVELFNKSFWKDKRVLVTGGTGLVGSHIVEALLDSGAKAIVPYILLDNESYFVVNGFDKKVTLAPCDIKDRDKVFQLVSTMEVDIILHLGAQAIVPTAYTNPVETLETNITGTVNILEATRHTPSVKAVVVASSDKAYGASDQLPYVEDFPLKGKHPYDCSKSCTDLISQMYAATYGVPVAITRFGNIFGEGDLNFNRIIPGIFKAALTGEKLLIRSDGKMIREYVYVKDVVNGYLLLAEKIEQTKGHAYNFTSEKKSSVIDLVKEVSEIIKKDVRIEILNIAKGEIPAQYLSCEKAKKELSWKPSYAFRDSILRTFRWYEQNVKFD